MWLFIGHNFQEPKAPLMNFFAIEEFHSLINWLLTRNHNNICTCAATCMEILKTFDYTQHVKQPTHKGIHILDLIIARSKDNIVRHTSVVDLGLSDHYAVRCKVLLGNWLLSKRKKLTKISLKRIDHAPARSKVVTLRPKSLWFSSEIQEHTEV